MDATQQAEVRAFLKIEKERIRKTTPQEGRGSFKALEVARLPLLGYLQAGAIAHAEFVLIEALAEYGLTITERAEG